MEDGLLFGKLMFFLSCGSPLDACYVICRALNEFLGFVHCLSVFAVYNDGCVLPEYYVLTCLML